MTESAYPLKGRVREKGEGGGSGGDAAGFKQLFAGESTHTTLVDISRINNSYNIAEKK